MERIIDNLPVTCIISLNPETRQTDFINLNAGKAVDASHMLNLQTDAGITFNPVVSRLAREIAQLLRDDFRSHVNNLVDVYGTGKATFTLKNVANPHKSEQVLSLYGTAMICEAYGKDAQWGADRIIEAWVTLSEMNAELVGLGGVLCPPPLSGKKSAAYMIIGMGNALAYRQLLLKQDKPTDADLEIFSKSADTVFGDVTELLNSEHKREVIGDFISALCEDMQEEEQDFGWHDGIPIPFGILFSMASIGRSALPKAAKAKRGRKAKAVPVEVEDVEPSEVIEFQGEESDTDPAYAVLENGGTVEDALDEPTSVSPPFDVNDEMDDEDPFV